MITIIRSADQTIKSFGAGADPTCDSAAGESVEYLNTDLNEYATRLTLSAQGKTGVTLSVPLGSDEVTVEVVCQGHSNIDLAMNGIVRTVALVNGKGVMTISTETAGVYVIAPADRVAFCAAGNGLLCVEVTD
jgi:hypothetical protein